MEGGGLFSVVSGDPGHRNNLKAGHTEVTHLPCGGPLLVELVFVHSAYGARTDTGRALHTAVGTVPKISHPTAQMLPAEPRPLIKSDCCSLSISRLWKTSEPNSSPVTTGDTGSGSVNTNLVSITRCSAGTKPQMKQSSCSCSFLL